MAGAKPRGIVGVNMPDRQLSHIQVVFWAATCSAKLQEMTNRPNSFAVAVRAFVVILKISLFVSSLRQGLDFGFSVSCSEPQTRLRAGPLTTSRSGPQSQPITEEGTVHNPLTGKLTFDA